MKGSRPQEREANQSKGTKIRRLEGQTVLEQHNNIITK